MGGLKGNKKEIDHIKKKKNLKLVSHFWGELQREGQERRREEEETKKGMESMELVKFCMECYDLVWILDLCMVNRMFHF